MEVACDGNFMITCDVFMPLSLKGALRVICPYIREYNGRAFGIVPLCEYISK